MRQKIIELNSQQDIRLQGNQNNKLQEMLDVLQKMEQQSKGTSGLTNEQFEKGLTDIESYVKDISSKLSKNKVVDIEMTSQLQKVEMSISQLRAEKKGEEEELALELHKHEHHDGHRSRFLGIFWF